QGQRRMTAPSVPGIGRVLPEFRGNPMATPTYHNLIGGQWLPAASGKTILNLNPADHTDVVGGFPASHAEDVDLAVEAARKAFAKWRHVPAPKRAEILVRAG